MRDLSILIPARNEEFLARTVQDILENIEMDTEVLVGLDGAPANPPIAEHPRVRVIYESVSIGQRAMTNKLCKMSDAKYIMKADAHCAFDKGFDRKMIEKMEPDITMIPVMRNLHAFDWVCPDGHRRYQGPSGPCVTCGKPTVKDVVWIAKSNPQSICYRFDENMHFQYWNEYSRHNKADLTETLSIQGSCFMLTRDKYWELDISSEQFKSWGQQGVEVACKTWLSGGRVLVNRKTWYAHMFRTQGGDFGFPYPLSGREVIDNRELSKELFARNKWPGAKKSFEWLIKKFNPPGWEEKPPTKGILYYTDNHLNMKLANLIRSQLLIVNLPITSVSLKRMNFGNNIRLREERGKKTMIKQIVAGLKAMKEDIVYFCEHDVLYHPDHFNFTPHDKNTFYYNGNYWFLRLKDGFAVSYDVSPLSGLVVYREAALKHFEERLAFITSPDFDTTYTMGHVGFEPFTHGRVKWKYWCPFEVFMPENPNIDITHADNITWKRWEQKHFLKKPKFWHEADIHTIPGWVGLTDLLK